MSDDRFKDGPWSYDQRRRFENVSMSTPNPRPQVHDERSEHAILGMLSRTRGVGKTHELATMIQRYHLEDGYMICFSAREARRVHDRYGINTVSADNSTSGAYYSRAIPFVDPEVLGHLIGKHQKDISETCDHYLQRLAGMERALSAEKQKLRDKHIDLMRYLEDQRHKNAIVWMFYAMGKLK
jgi:hypothetical protein